MTFKIRPMAEDDFEEAIILMRKLAEFEGYLREFSVTEGDLKERAFSARPDFSVWVAGPRGRPLLGVAVTLRINWTHTLRPTLVLKELFVDAGHRGSGIGQALFARVLEEASEINAGKIEWLVLLHNFSAKRFYENLGGSRDAGWERWQLSL